MIKIIFRNLEESELAKELTLERIQTLIDRFPDLNDHKITIQLQMVNSQLKPGPDLFKVKILITGKKYSQITLEKSANSLYVAMALIVEYALERLNRYGDRKRVKNRTQARRLLNQTRIEKDEASEAV